MVLLAPPRLLSGLVLFPAPDPPTITTGAVRAIFKCDAVLKRNRYST